MKGRLGRIMAGLWVLAASATAIAQDGLDELTPDALTIERLTVQAFQGVPVDNDHLLACCAPQMITRDGQVLLWVRATFAPPWTEEVETVRVSHRDVALQVAGTDELLPIIGTYDLYGFFEVRTPHLAATRPGVWPERDPPVFFNAVFAVPEGAEAFTLDFGGLAAARIPMPPVGPHPAPGDIVSVTVRSAERIDAIPSVDRVGDQEIASVIRYTDGAILEVTLVVDPIAGNDLRDPRQFIWRTASLQLVYGDGQIAPQLGQYLGRSLIRNTTNAYRLDPEEPPREETLYFAVPNGADGFRLYLGSSQVATF